MFVLLQLDVFLYREKEISHVFKSFHRDELRYPIEISLVDKDFLYKYPDFFNGPTASFSSALLLMRLWLIRIMDFAHMQIPYDWLARIYIYCRISQLVYAICIIPFRVKLEKR